MAFPMAGGKKPFWPGKFGTSKTGKMGMKTDFSEPAEIGAANPLRGKKFMADGGMGGPPMPKGAPPAQDPDQDGDMDAPGGDLPPIDPTSVGFHADPAACGLCQFFDGGQCARLQIQVPAEGGCQLFMGHEGDDSQGMDPDYDMDQPDNGGAAPAGASSTFGA